MATHRFAVAALLVLASCSAPPGSDGWDAVDAGGGSKTDGAASPPRGDAGSTSSPDGSIPKDDAGQPQVPAGLAKLGTLVILGDSISDGGGQGPFYYDLLKQDLTAAYGAIQYVSHAQSGSQTSALGAQIDSLPKSLPGPVAVCITSGGNDMKASLPAILTGTDGPVRAQMGANIQTALAKLLAAGRFGAGVEAHVFEANIYDASDGKGDFGSHNCAFGKGVPATPTDGFYKSWNGTIDTEVAAKGQTLSDLHGRFYGHGYAANPSWYWSDCTHPDTLGHDQVRRMFYEGITGKTLP